MIDPLHKVGRIAGVFGLHGELKLDPTSAGADLFEIGAVFVARRVNQKDEEIAISEIRPHKGRFLIRLQGVLGASRAELYVGSELFAARSRVEAVLADDEILDAELVGMMLCTPEGRELAAVTDVVHFPGSAMFVVGPKRSLVPFVKAFVHHVDRTARRITVDLPIGLLEGEAEEA